jgi:hypothetical protein
MHKKLDHLAGLHSAGAGLPNTKPTVHYVFIVARLDELPATGDGTSENQDVVSQSWDIASGTGNACPETTDDGLTLVHDSEMGL